MKQKQAGRQAGVSGQSASPIGRAVAELETEKANLLARVEKVDQAIVSLRALFHLPKPAAPGANGNGNGNGKSDSTPAIRAALSSGPLSPAALAIAVGLDRPALRYQLRALERDGVVVSTGSTANRRVALASHAAKEAL